MEIQSMIESLEEVLTELAEAKAKDGQAIPYLYLVANVVKFFDLFNEQVDERNTERAGQLADMIHGAIQEAKANHVI